MDSGSLILKPIKSFFAIFTRKESEKEQNDIEAAKKSLKNLIYSADKFAQKSEGLMQEKYPEISEKIKSIQKKIHSLKPDVSTLAGKHEQAITQKITIASSLCDTLLSSGEKNDLTEQLSDLARVVSQREKLA